MNLQKRSPSRHLVADTARPQSMTINGRVDGDHRLAKPCFGLRRESRHREVGADLHDRFDLGIIHLKDRVAQSRLAHMRDRDRAFAFQPDDLRHLEAAFLEEACHILVADWEIRGDDADPFDSVKI